MGSILDTPPWQPSRPDIAVVALDVGKAMFLAQQLPRSLNHRFSLALVGSSIFDGYPYAAAYASVDLSEEVRTDEEDEWFRRKLMPLLKGPLVYVDSP